MFSDELKNTAMLIVFGTLMAAAFFLPLGIVVWLFPPDSGVLSLSIVLGFFLMWGIYRVRVCVETVLTKSLYWNKMP